MHSRSVWISKFWVHIRPQILTNDPHPQQYSILDQKSVSARRFSCTKNPLPVHGSKIFCGSASATEFTHFWYTLLASRDVYRTKYHHVVKGTKWTQCRKSSTRTFKNSVTTFSLNTRSSKHTSFSVTIKAAPKTLITTSKNYYNGPSLQHHEYATQCHRFCRFFTKRFGFCRCHVEMEVEVLE